MYQSFVSSNFFYTFARMKRLTIITLALLSLNIMTAAKTNKTVTLRIIETSDVHGAFFPYDFIERRPMNGTMARVSTYLKRQRQKFGNRLILLDNGDILQGQPTCYYKVAPAQAHKHASRSSVKPFTLK